MSENKAKETERLQVVLARAGLASRRGVVSMIEEGKVVVNGKTITEKGFRVNAALDQITVDGKPIASNEISKEKYYFLLNKPKNVMTTLQDPHAEKTVADFFKDIPVRVFPVGRLDRDTTGLLIMTNDGELAFRLTHPKFGVKKKYRAVVRGAVKAESVKKIERGIDLEEGRTAPCQIKIESTNPKETLLFITIHEGKKRQIRRVFESVGHRVIELERLGYGPLELGDLRWGSRRQLKAHEVQQLKDIVGLK